MRGRGEGVGWAQGSARPVTSRIVSASTSSSSASSTHMVIMAASTPSVRAGISSAMAVAHAQKSHSAPPSLPVPLVLVSAATTVLQLPTVSWSGSCRQLSLAHAPKSASRVALDEQPKAPLSMTA